MSFQICLDIYAVYIRAVLTTLLTFGMTYFSLCSSVGELRLGVWNEMIPPLHEVGNWHHSQWQRVGGTIYIITTCGKSNRVKLLLFHHRYAFSYLKKKLETVDSDCTFEIEISTNIMKNTGTYVKRCAAFFIDLEFENLDL